MQQRFAEFLVYGGPEGPVTKTEAAILAGYSKLRAPQEGSDAVKNAVIFVEKDGKLHEVKRMEVQENTQPILGHKGHVAHRLVIKTEKPSSLILPDKLLKDY